MIQRNCTTLTFCWNCGHVSHDKDQPAACELCGSHDLASRPDPRDQAEQRHCPTCGGVAFWSDSFEQWHCARCDPRHTHAAYC